ncbi:MAG TPA: hypothetical protein P5086_06765 [Prolixibacteraceae bacterium]|jgi:hypothetical protein|nr:hypothetical protein [Prolixibacteraceae bacterium]HPJ79827.1 hypothetical protein [Prolixibacteraceae bacterium]HRV89002.1 hypothetical protein [Prolixibacteraceae bacterium]
MAALTLFVILLVPVFMIAQYFVNPSLVFTLMTWTFSESRAVTREYPGYFDA